MPKGLDRIYDRTWREVLNLAEDDQERAGSILRWAAFAMRPLTVFELAEALSIDADTEPEDINLDDVPPITEEYINRGIKRLCGSFVDIRPSNSDDDPGSRTLHLIHPSAKEYLLRPRQSTSIHLLLSDESSQHKILARTCLKLLNNEPVWRRPYSGFLVYASKKWHRHVLTTTKEDPDLTPYIGRFFLEENACFEAWSSKSLARKQRDDEDINFQSGGPLYRAALLNLTPILMALRHQSGTSLNEVQGRFGTALQGACVRGSKEAVDLLLQWGADVNQVAGECGTALVAAARASHGSKETVALLLDHGADTAQVVDSKWGPTALFAAAVAQEDASISELLLSHGAATSADVRNTLGWTLLNVVARKNNLEIARLLLQHHVNPNTPADSGIRPLSRAALFGHVNMVRVLLDYGADIDAVDGCGYTALLYSIFGETKPSTTSLLLERGANTSITSAEGVTAIHIATSKGRVDLVKLLLEYHADLDTAYKCGFRPLHIAASKDRLELVKLLLEHGADPTRTQTLNGKDPGETALSHAARRGNSSVVECLIDTGIDIEALCGSPKSETVLGHAATLGNMRILQQVYEKDPTKSSIVDEYGRTPLHWAALKGHVQVFNYLLERGSDPTVKDLGGQTLLHFAATSSSLGMVQRVRELSDSADYVSSEAKWTPLHWASRSGDAEVVTALLGAGLKEISVEALNPLESFTPLEIAHYHGNTTLSSMENCPLRLRGKVHFIEVGKDCAGRWTCDLCTLVSDAPLRS